MNILNQARLNLIDNFNQPVNAVYYYWVKIILGTLYLWKLLSRGFSNVALWPKDVALGYPIDIYAPDQVDSFELVFLSVDNNIKTESINKVWRVSNL